MTETISASQPAAAAPAPIPRASMICLVSSFVVSGLSLLLSVVAFWQVRMSNVRVASEGGGHIRDLTGDWSAKSDRPMYLFLMVVAGSAAMILALVGARAARQAWINVLAGALAMTMLMVPVVVVANELLTAGIYPGD